MSSAFSHLSYVQPTLQVVYVVSAVIVLFESLNKLERVTPFAPGLTPRVRMVDALKALAWSLLAMGAAGALAGPLLMPWGIYPAAIALLTRADPALSDVCVLAGFAVLIVRTRVKEG